jgi:hypothetical protein
MGTRMTRILLMFADKNALAAGKETLPQQEPDSLITIDFCFRVHPPDSRRPCSIIL